MTTRADPPNCTSVIAACDKAIDAKNAALWNSTQALLETKKLQKSQEKDLAEANAKLSAWYRNPYLLLGLGVLGGMVIAK